MDSRPAFTVDDLAAHWSCSADVIYALLRQKKLKGFKLGNTWRITAREVDRFENNE